MERAARVANDSQISKNLLAEEDLIRASWTAAVGKIVASHTSRLRLVRSTLIVEVEDAIWQRQLFTMSSQIVSRLRKVTGSPLVTDVEFRIGVPRREPQRAPAAHATPLTPDQPADEAERIQDPVLKKVYRLSRKKATA
jgi:hypothetical protein